MTEEGKILTNGENYGTTISLAEGANPDDYYEITMDEYNTILKEQDTQEMPE